MTPAFDSLDSIVKCGWPGCEESMRLYDAWIDNGRFLCEPHAMKVLAEREAHAREQKKKWGPERTPDDDDGKSARKENDMDTS